MTKELDNAGANAPTPQLVDVDTMASILSVQKSWIYRKARETGPKSMPRVKCGKYLRFSPKAVLKWISEQ